MPEYREPAGVAPRERVGFFAAYIILYGAIGLPPVRRFFSRYGVWVTRIVGIVFIGFGAKSLLDGARDLASARS